MPKPIYALVLAMICSLTWLIAPADRTFAQETAQDAPAQEPASQEPIAQEAASIEDALAVEDGSSEAPLAAEAAHDEPAAEAAHAAGEVVDAHAAEGSEGGAHEIEGYNSEQWWNFFYRVINFIVYVGILYFLLRKPVAAYFNGRREGIASKVEYLETQAKNYEEQAKVMRRQIDDMTAERAEILKRYEADGAKERDRIISDAQKAAELIIQRAQTAMEQEIKGARRLLTIETGELAMTLAKELLAQTVTGDDRVRLAHDFVEQVVKLPAKN